MHEIFTNSFYLQCEKTLLHCTNYRYQYFVYFQSLIIVRLPLSQAAQCKKDAATAAGFGGRFLGVGGKVCIKTKTN